MTNLEGFLEDPQTLNYLMEHNTIQEFKGISHAIHLSIRQTHPLDNPLEQSLLNQFLD